MKTRKELKEEYKQMKFKIGVFRLKNEINGKVFIGSSLDLVAIWNSLRLQLQMGSYPNSELQSDWKKYGSENFTYQILDEIKQTDDHKGDYRDDIKALEELILEERQPFDDRGYNKRKLRIDK